MTMPSILITGDVAHERAVTAAEMRSLPNVVDDASRVATGAVGHAVRVAEVLAQSEPLAEATHCTVIAAEGAYRASIPLPDLLEGGWLAFELDGEPLPAAKGGPFRLTVAAGSTLCWNVKEVVTLRVTRGPEPDDVPENPPH